MNKRILLVDDDRAVRESLTRVLVQEGYSVLPAENGQEALNIAAVAAVDLVLLDLNLPVLNGWDTFERLTAQNPLLPILVITARPNQIFPALASGVGGLMEKPLDFPRLLRTIGDMIAEPAETRLARLAGKPTQFHYFPRGRWDAVSDTDAPGNPDQGRHSDAVEAVREH
jgi:DNA-binding response OmpR family regulator